MLAVAPQALPALPPTPKVIEEPRAQPSFASKSASLPQSLSEIEDVTQADINFTFKSARIPLSLSEIEHARQADIHSSAASFRERLGYFTARESYSEQSRPRRPLYKR